MWVGSICCGPPEDIEFRNLDSSLNDVEIPALPENRSRTDKIWLLIFGIVILIFLPFMAYTLAKTDIHRFGHGFDNCGNICGFDNSKIADITCSGKDYTDLPYSKLGHFEDDGRFRDSICVEWCPKAFMGICIDPKVDDTEYYSTRVARSSHNSTVDSFMEETLKYCQNNWWNVLVSLVISLVLSLAVLLLFRYSPAVLVWGMLIFGLILLSIKTYFAWYNYVQESNMNEDGPALTIAITSTIITLGAIIVVAVLHKKIALVILLYKEATKAIFAMPHLLLVTSLISIIQLIILGCFITSIIWMTTSAELEKYQDNIYKYQQNGVMIMTMIFNALLTVWTMHFFVGVECMIIAGSVAAWYFARNKDQLKAPIWTSVLITFKFHLGTIALGSFILTVVSVIKFIIESLMRNQKIRIIVSCCLQPVKNLLEFLSRNAYVQSAMHGHPFIKSGKRALHLLLDNAASTVAIGSIGEFILGVTIFVLVSVSTAISYGLFMGPIKHAWLLLIICFVVNIFAVAFIFSVYLVTIETLFVCFCEDKCMNDGISRPYYMSRGLMEFIENSKKIYKPST